MKQIYLLSGLGADYRVLQDLDFSGYETTYIKWIQPIENELIEDYAKRLIEQIKTKNPIIIGLSFGGMMAAEIGKLINTEKIILIASAKTKFEIPFYYRFAGSLGLHKLLPANLMKRPNFISYWFFGTQSKKDKALLASILHDTDSVFLKWAIDKIVNWQNVIIPLNLKHIHGTSDRILPYGFVLADVEIKAGGHFMTTNKVEELSPEIRKILNITL
jgi:pimeloyl-ACP methyl ester carboxylesterase